MTLRLTGILLAGLFIACQNLELSIGHDGQMSTQCSSAITNKLIANHSNITMPNDEFDWQTEYQKFIYIALNRTNLTKQELHDALRQKMETLLFPAQDKTTTTKQQKVGLMPLDEDKKSKYTSPTDGSEPNDSESDPPSNIKFKTEPIIAGGKTVQASGLEPLEQWHVGIYSKAFEPYMQICGGSLVTTKAVISAAHCFWSESEGGVLPASQFGVAAGKLLRPWNESFDLDAQHADISAIHLPTRYRGAATSFQDDIAVLLLLKEFTISAALRPLCVSFDEELESDLLRSGNEGLIVGWGLTEEDGTPAQTLQYLYMPYVPVEECLATAEPGFLKYITSDKICAGVTTGKALCRGDSGGGFVFFDLSYGEPLPYLFGVASTAPRNAHRCNTRARAALTSVSAHRAFLRTHIPNIEDSCSEYYEFSRTLKPGIEDKLAGPHCQPAQSPAFNCNCFCNCNNSTTP